MGAFFYVLLVFFVLSSVLLIGLVLLRKGEGGGVSAAFAGIGGDTAFGVKAAKQLDKIIGWLAFIFLVIAILLAGQSAQRQPTPEEEAPAGEPPAEGEEPAG